MCALPVSNGSESPERKNLVLTGIAGLMLAIGLFWLFFFVAQRGRSELRRHLADCDRDYRAAITERWDLGPVRDCYVDNFRLEPWDREVAFRIQSAADLEAERRSPAAGPLTELAQGDISACNRIERDPRLAEKVKRDRWLQLCLILTR